MKKTSFTYPLLDWHVPMLKASLEKKNFSFGKRPYAHFSASRDKVNVTVYEKGPKVLVQGKGAEDFVRYVLEPEVLGEARLGYEEVHSPEMFAPHFGIDESGKGDFLGPLVISGAYVDKAISKNLMDAGVQDSKAIGSDQKIQSLAEKIRATPNILHHTILISPKRYNEMYASFQNLNKLLAWGHAKVIETLHHKKPDCPRALSDQFDKTGKLPHALNKLNIPIQLDQRTKAESDIAVAAASILAREKFVLWMEKAGQDAGLNKPLPKGASAQVTQTAKQLKETLGKPALTNYCKQHFKTYLEL